MTRYGIDTRSVTREQLAAALAAEFTFLKPESGSFQKSAAAIFAALPQPAPAPGLDVPTLAKALHESAPETHHRRKCIDRHDLRAAEIAAEYARLRGGA